jgi:HD-GYP domain-containing protein (c-di-GMP phosphodiesterase class II)
VATHAIAIGQRLGPQETPLYLAYGLFHDIGKVKIPKDPKQTGKLLPEELAMMMPSHLRVVTTMARRNGESFQPNDGRYF